MTSSRSCLRHVYTTISRCLSRQFSFGLLSAILSVSHQNDAEGPASVYLSDHLFRGLHILERQGGLGVERLRLYRDGKRAVAHDLPIAMWRDFGEARRELALALVIPPRERFQSDWEIYTSQGHRIDNLQMLRSVEVAFVLEIGAWMWPAVRVGFEHVVQNVDGGKPKVLRTLSINPVIFEVIDFIQPAECDKVIRHAEDVGLEASEGQMSSVDLEKGTDHTEFRTSKQTWVDNMDSEVVSALDGRTANLTRIQSSHNEPAQVLLYEETNYYHGHVDWTDLSEYRGQPDVWTDQHFGHQDRLATVFWYLNSVPDGGETIFLKHGHPVCSKHNSTCRRYDVDVISCDKGFKIKPIRGKAILWYNFHADGTGDENTLHMGCPVGKGLVKWSVNKWVLIKPVSTKSVEWDDDHPALARHMYDSREPCEITFVNDARMTVGVFWLREDDNEEQVGSINAGEALSLNTFREDEFILQGADGRTRSMVVSCIEEPGMYHLDSSFSVEWVLQRKENQERRTSRLEF